MNQPHAPANTAAIASPMTGSTSGSTFQPSANSTGVPPTPALTTSATPNQSPPAASMAYALDPSEAQQPPHTNPYAIRVRHLWHRFGSHNVLRDVSFDVEQGQIFGFIGPNGAGKTTAIRVIATLYEPMAGRVEVDGLDVAVDPDRVRRIIGYMPDHAGIYERITLKEYLEFFADAYQVPSLGAVETVMELTDLAQIKDKLVVQMSKGMKQRLQLARVLLHDPKILLLDEPASDLDPRARIEMRDLLLELSALGKTILLSSHILTELADVCGAVAILERGAIVVSGPLAEISYRLEQRAAQAGAYGQHLAYPNAPPAGTMPLQPPQPPQEAGQPQPPQESTPQASESRGQPNVTPAGVEVPRAARKRLKLRVLASAERIAPLLSAMPAVIDVHLSGPTLAIVDYQGTDRFVASLVHHLVTHGVPLVGVEPERNELERIFLEVTHGAMQ